MDYIKEAENYLRHYKELKSSIKHAEHEIAKLKWKSRPGEVSAVSNDITGVTADHPGNTLNEMYQLQKWQDVRDESNREMQHVENLLAGMEEKERKVLEMWYVQRMDKYDIAAELGYNSKQPVYNTRNKAIKKFAVILFGINALKAII